MNNICHTCKQELPKPKFKRGDLVQTSYGELAIVPDTYLTELLDKAYGGPAGVNGIWLVSIKGHAFSAQQFDLTLLHGTIRLLERVK